MMHGGYSSRATAGAMAQPACTPHAGERGGVGVALGVGLTVGVFVGVGVGVAWVQFTAPLTVVVIDPVNDGVYLSW